MQTRKIKIGVVGLRFGLTVIENLMASQSTEYIELAGVYDLDSTKVDKISTDYHVTGYRSFEELLADTSLDAVALYTPPTGRSDMIRRIMESGKHVMTTKPFETDWRKAKAILQESQRMGKVIYVNSPDVCFNNVVSAVKAAVEQYDLGRPIGARWDVWVNYNEKPDGSWYDSPERCPVAPIFRLGIYIINDLVALFGAVHELSVFSSRLVTQRPTVDNALLALSFKNGAVASIFGSFCVDDGQRYKGPMVLNFERGTFCCDVFPNGAPGQKDLILTRKNEEGATISEKIDVHGSARGEYLWELFRDAVCAEQPITDAYIARVVEGVRVLEGMQQADSSGKIIAIDDI